MLKVRERVRTYVHLSILHPARLSIRRGNVVRTLTSTVADIVIQIGDPKKANGADEAATKNGEEVQVIANDSAEKVLRWRDVARMT